MSSTLTSSLNASSNDVLNCLFTEQCVKFIEVRQSIKLFISIVKVESAVPQAAQAQNTRSYMFFFFLLICERSAKLDMGHILLPNNRIRSREM